MGINKKFINKIDGFIIQIIILDNLKEINIIIL